MGCMHESSAICNLLFMSFHKIWMHCSINRFATNIKLVGMIYAATSNHIIYLDTKSIRWWWWWWDNFMQICTDFLSYAYVNQWNIYSKITVQLMMVEVKSTQNFGCNCAPLWILQSMRNKQTQDATLKTNANHTYFGIIFKCVRAYYIFRKYTMSHGKHEIGIRENGLVQHFTFNLI